jgi:transaldolase
MKNRIKQIQALGQSIWIDYISRDLLQSGGLKTLVDEGVSGLTSNPTIFEQAVSGGSSYDAQIGKLAAEGKSTADIYEALIIDDIREAADHLREAYEQSHQRDGFVSIEVSPKLAHDAEATVAEARRLHRKIDRPNVMIKVPATEAGLPAMRTLISEGICVNATLIFSIARYEQVTQAYIDGVRAWCDSGGDVRAVASVASFFVSRVDTAVDKLLEQRGAAGNDGLEDLFGVAAIANAKMAYVRFKEVFEGAPFADLRNAGAAPQRPLWASTSTKNPNYPDTKYVAPLIGVLTVNTVPMATLDAIRDHLVVAQTIEQDVSEAQTLLDRLHRAAGIDMNAVTGSLLVEGVDKFEASFDQLMAVLEEKRASLQPAG